VLVKGKWVENWQPVQAKDEQGGFLRQISGFRNWVTPDGAAGPTGSGGFKAEAGRYHLYVAYICPWASRTLMARKIKGLEDVVSVSVVEPELTDQGWRFGTGFPGSDKDPINAATYLHEIYTRADLRYSGRATVPVLWDKKTGTIVNNESADILRMFNSGFGALASGPDLNPEDLADDIEALNATLYPGLNNGVYRAGFATTQIAYDAAYEDVFRTLDQIEERLERGGPFLFGERLSESDIRLFVTTVRFDAAYHGLFKCNLRRLADYPALSRHLRAMLALPGIRDTVRIDHIKAGYYSIKSLNPNGIIPKGPDLAWDCAPVKKDSLVIFLHGIGSRGAELAPLAGKWSEALPRTAFEMPDAPARFPTGANGHQRGHQWFSVDGVSNENRAERVKAARPAFDAIIAAAMERHGLKNRPDRVALVGFSQGAIMALDAVGSGRWPFAAVVGFSGRLAVDPVATAAANSNVLLIHGGSDPVIPATESLRAEDLLTRAGIAASARVLAGLGHTISAKGAVWAEEFLRAVLN
jgi:putative glutathione S-transferase